MDVPQFQQPITSILIQCPIDSLGESRTHVPRIDVFGERNYRNSTRCPIDSIEYPSCRNDALTFFELCLFRVVAAIDAELRSCMRRSRAYFWRIAMYTT